MTTQAARIQLELDTEGWKVETVESPTSKQYWWMWELWSLKKDNQYLYLSFLVDPQCEKSKSNVWAVSANKTEPRERREAESGVILTLGQGWENRLVEFITDIRNRYEAN